MTTPESDATRAAPGDVAGDAASDAPGILVTGATRGIGAAVAGVLTRRGARVALMARDRGGLEASAAELGARWVRGDVSVREDVDAAVARLTESDFGVPDVVVNAAGTFDIVPLDRCDPEVFDRNLAVNLRGPYLLIRALLPLMISRGSGLIVTIGSVAGRRAFPGNGAYSASKFGVRGLHEVLLEEVRGTGVRATLIEPAATDTGLWDALDPDSDPHLPDRAAMLRPEDVAEAVAFVVSRPHHVRVPFLAIDRA